MKKFFILHMVLFALICSVLVCPSVKLTALAAADGTTEDSVLQEPLIEEPKVYRIVVNNARFDGTVYDYDLSEYFEDSDIRHYTYAIIGNDDLKEVIKLSEKDNNIMLIIPTFALDESIKVCATDAAGDLFTVTLELKFLDAPTHLSNAMLGTAIVALILLLLFIIATSCLSSFGGKVQVFLVENGVATDSKQIPLKHILGFAWISGQSPIKGFFFGKRGNYVKFVPQGTVYTNDCDEATPSFAIQASSDTMFFSDPDKQSGINVYFYR
ncbi:MAG: hypothetical protein IKU84_06390 [Clostridia bacterium]|nr:hypothetical protein [Clostridia bacterium]